SNVVILRPVSMIIEKCTIEGSGSGSSQNGLYLGGGVITVKYCAIYNCGDNGLSSIGFTILRLEYVNNGVEQANGDNDFYFYAPTSVTAKGLNYNSGVLIGSYYLFPGMYIEDFAHTEGAHKVIHYIGTISKTDVVVGSGDPEKRTGGSDSVVEILYNQNVTGKQPIAELAPTVFPRVLVADGTERTFRFFVQSVPALTTELWFDVSYVDLAGHPCTMTATGAISARSNAADWTNYIDVTVPAALSESNIHIDCKSNYYSSSSTNKIYIDPKFEEQ
ncbi:MAG: hypothetical protein AB1772_13370, partial [Candidatus Zixiibacteriota bacterium]